MTVSKLWRVLQYLLGAAVKAHKLGAGPSPDFELGAAMNGAIAITGKKNPANTQNGA